MPFKSQVIRLRILFMFVTLLLLGNCREEPDCNHFPDRQGTAVPFMFVDSMTGENLVSDYSDNQKRIHVDSLALFNHVHELFPATPAQWTLENHGVRGYIVFIYLFDQLEVPNVDIYTPGSVTYYLYSGKFDYDTIVFDYSFERGKHCYSETDDTLSCFVNGKAAEFSTGGHFNSINDVFAIKK